jgi:UDP-glucose 4-epimerase
MNFLITGAAGCIGSELAMSLLAQGHTVVGIDNFSSGKPEHIEAASRCKEFHFIEADILSPGTVESALGNKVEMVYHLAANADIKYQEGESTNRDLEQNVLATYRVLEAMRVRRVNKLAFASTSAVYGIAKRLPIPEDYPSPKPISLYGASKLACEAYISAFTHLFGMQSWIFRFANIVGPKVRAKGGTVIGDFVQRLKADPTRLKILGNGKQAKSYLLCEECVEGMLFGVDHATEELNILNLGASDSITVARIAQMVSVAMGLEGVRFEFGVTAGGWLGDVPQFMLDVSRINQLGWRARHSSEEAIAQAINAMLGRIEIGQILRVANA